MIERIRLALRPWAEAFTREEARQVLREIHGRHLAREAADAEVASWHYEPHPEEILGAPPSDKVHLGHHAKRLLDDPVMRLAFERVSADLTTTWRSTASDDREKREDAYRMLRALDGLEGKLRAFTGNAALIAAEQRRKEAEEARGRRGE